MANSLFHVSCLTVAVMACFSTNVVAYNPDFTEDKTYSETEIGWDDNFRIQDGVIVSAENSSITVTNDTETTSKIQGSLTAKNLTTTGGLETRSTGTLTVNGTLYTATLTNVGEATIGQLKASSVSNNSGGKITVNQLEAESVFTQADSVLTVKSGLIKGKLQNSGAVYLTSDNAKIEGTLWLAADSVLKKNEDSNLTNLEVTEGKVNIANDLTVENDLTLSSANVTGNLTVGGKFIQSHTTTEDYTIFREGSSSEIGSFVSNTTRYGFKVMRGAKLTVNTMNMSGAVDVDGGNLTINQSASVGALHNAGSIDAPNAEIIVTADQTLTDQYAFTNGLHIGSDGTFDDSDKANSSFVARSLTVEGNALNESKDEGTSLLKVNQITVTGDYTNNGLTSISHGDGSFNKIVGKEGSFALEDAVLSVTSSSALGDIQTVGTSVSTVNLGAGDYVIGAFSGDNKVLRLNDIKNTTVNIESKDGSMTLSATGAANDQYSNVSEAVKAIQSNVTVNSANPNDKDQLEIAEGTINNGYKNGQEIKNSKLDAFSSINVLAAMTLRHEMNSLSKRMGELRDSPSGVGAWIRAYGSEMEYGDQNVTAKNNSIQVGSDYSLGDWKVGVAFSYTDGDSSYDSGSSDNKGYGLAVYGTWLIPCGAYIDLIAKYNRLDTDFSLSGMNGSYENNAFTVSAETGYRFNFMDGGFYVEPQVGLSYGRIMGDTLTTSNNVKLQQDDYDSFLGRVGVRTGFKFPENKGTVYARVSGVYDFDGEMNGKASVGNSKNSFEADLGGAWLEMGVGANFNWTKSTYSYLDFERTNGGDVKENWRWNVGIRHVF